MPEALTSPAHHTRTRRVEFADTDAAGVAHFSRLLTMVEETFHDWLRSLDVPILDTSHAWPVVSLSTDFSAKASFGEELAITIRPVDKGTTSLTCAFTADGRRGTAFSGTITLCHLDPASGKPSPLPAAIPNPTP